jgi:hypothetical protein
MNNIKLDSQIKINYIEKIDIIKNKSIYYENINKILFKLAYFKTNHHTDSLINKNYLTELNIYIKTFIEELQKPLNTIHTGLNILINNILELNNPELEKNIELIIDLDKTLKYINNSFTKLISINDGLINLRPFEPFDFQYIIIKIESIITDDLYEKNIRFEYNIDDKIIDWFVGDVYNIIFILKKIILNAIKYAKLNNNIFVNITLEQSNLNKKKIIIDIIDNNEHISPKIKEILFTSPSGLYICKSILELHNGTIEHNYLNNIGNIFTIKLNLEVFTINNDKLKVFTNNKLTKSIKSLDLLQNKIYFEVKSYNALIIDNNDNERLYLYKIFKLNKIFNNIFSFNNGLDAICKMYNNLLSIDVIIINIDLFDREFFNINGVANAKLLRSINYNRLLIGICNSNDIKFIQDNSFDYIFYHPFDRNKINLLIDFIEYNGVNLQSNKKIKLIDNELKWVFI